MNHKANINKPLYAHPNFLFNDYMMENRLTWLIYPHTIDLHFNI